MKKWTIGKRIITSNVILITLLLIISGVAISSLNSLQVFADAHLRKDSIPGINYMSDMASYSLRSQIRALLAGNESDPAKRDKNISRVGELDHFVSEAMTNYEASISTPEDGTNFEKLKEIGSNCRILRDHYLALVMAGKTQEADAFYSAQMDSALAAYRDKMGSMLKWNQDVALKTTDQMIHTAQSAKRVAIAIAIVSVLIAIALGWVIIRSINRILNNVASSLADGSDQVASAAGQVSSSSQSLAEGASEQAASLEETSSSLEEMSSMTKRNADNAQMANDLAKQARAAADKGSTDMHAMSSAMEAIKVSSDDIAKIIKTIDEIAFQTNILALNAAVEAARAGEAGMGFAVVADEVRNLAQRSAQAAKETAAKIEGAITKTGQGVEISGTVVQTLNDIVAKVRQVDELISEVAGASREQTQGITQINTAVGQMDKVTQSNAANAEESAAAAEELNAQAASMKESVNELLQLVSGAGQEPKTKPGMAPSVSIRLPATVAHRSKDNGHALVVPKATNGNGRHSKIPLEGDFRDF